MGLSLNRIADHIRAVPLGEPGHADIDGGVWTLGAHVDLDHRGIRAGTTTVAELHIGIDPLGDDDYPGGVEAVAVELDMAGLLSLGEACIAMARRIEGERNL